MTIRHALTRPTWWAAAGVRALKTAAQTAAGLLGSNQIGLTDADWAGVGSAAGIAAILSLLTSLGGLPEVEDPATPVASSVDPD